MLIIMACVHYFLSNFYFSPNDSPSENMKNAFYFSKKFFSFSRYSNFCISAFFLSVSHCFRGWWKINVKLCDIINCVNKNFVTHFVWYPKKVKRYDIDTLSIDRVLNKEHFYWKIMQKMCTRGYSQTRFLTLVGNPKKPMHAKNYFKNKVFWKRIIKKL